MIRSPFSKSLHEKLTEAIATRSEGVASGVPGDDAATVGMNYRYHVGHIAGLKEALSIADELDTESNR